MRAPLSYHWLTHLMGMTVTTALLVVAGYRLTHRCEDHMTKLAEATELMKAGRYALAYDKFGECDKSLAALSGKVECCFYMGDDSQLVIDAEELKRIEGGKGIAYYFLGIMHRRARQFDAAQFELLRSQRENYPLAQVALANLRRTK